MATPLRKRKRRLQFETDETFFDRGRHRAVMVEVLPRFAMLRLKGTQRTLTLPWSVVYGLAEKLEFQRLQREKKAGKA